MKRLLIVFTLILCKVQAGDQQSTNVASLFQTSENLLMVTSPDRVEACILYVKDPWFSHDLKKRKYKEGEYKQIPNEEARLLSAKLTDEKTYRWDSAKACMPVYNARIKFIRGEHMIYADLCFHCDIVLFSRDGTPFSGEDFDAIDDIVFEIVRYQFPRDRVIRKLIEHYERNRQFKAQVRIAKELEKLNQSAPKINTSQ